MTGIVCLQVTIQAAIVLLDYTCTCDINTVRRPVNRIGDGVCWDDNYIIKY